MAGPPSGIDVNAPEWMPPAGPHIMGGGGYYAPPPHHHHQYSAAPLAPMDYGAAMGYGAQPPQPGYGQPGGSYYPPPHPHHAQHHYAAYGGGGGGPYQSRPRHHHHHHYPRGGGGAPPSAAGPGMVAGGPDADAVIEAYDVNVKANIKFRLSDCEPNAATQLAEYTLSQGGSFHLPAGADRNRGKICVNYLQQQGYCRSGEHCRDFHVSGHVVGAEHEKVHQWMNEKEAEFTACQHATNFKVFYADLKEVISVPGSAIAFTRGLYLDPADREKRPSTIAPTNRFDANGGPGAVKAVAIAQQAPTACGLFAHDPTSCKWGKWCNQAHVYSEWIEAHKQQFESWSQSLQSRFDTMPSDTIFQIHDPMSRSLVDVPKDRIQLFTRGLLQGSTEKHPSVCLLDQSHRCTAGTKCNQVHVDAAFLQHCRANPRPSAGAPAGGGGHGAGAYDIGGPHGQQDFSGQGGGQRGGRRNVRVAPLDFGAAHHGAPLGQQAAPPHSSGGPYHPHHHHDHQHQHQQHQAAYEHAQGGHAAPPSMAYAGAPPAAGGGYMAPPPTYAVVHQHHHHHQPAPYYPISSVAPMPPATAAGTTASAPPGARAGTPVLQGSNSMAEMVSRVTETPPTTPLLSSGSPSKSGTAGNRSSPGGAGGMASFVPVSPIRPPPGGTRTNDPYSTSFPTRQTPTPTGMPGLGNSLTQMQPSPGASSGPGFGSLSGMNVPNTPSTFAPPYLNSPGLSAMRLSQAGLEDFIGNLRLGSGALSLAAPPPQGGAPTTAAAPPPPGLNT